MVSPYEEIILSGIEKIRTFSECIDEDDLKWHWDEEDRMIEPIHKTDWMFQFDNQLPIKLEGKIEIKKGVWHRLIKGNSDVRIKIKK